MIESVIDFLQDGRRKQFIICHNLPELGLDIEAGFHCWWPRAERISQRQFINYLKDKLPFAIVLSKSEYDRLNTP